DRNDDDMRRLIGADIEPAPISRLEQLRHTVADAGFTIIDCREEFPAKTYSDVGVLACALPEWDRARRRSPTTELNYLPPS
ncbi:MAG TPA: hypothetical protein VNW94_11000, partial [Streptosporangiaceae bacterium]|nr:hypothetical protein [Streptosporangiaceae bacterium]